MGQTLQGKTPASTYKDLLHLGNNNLGLVDGELRVVDGKGDDSVLLIGKNSATFKPTAVNGEVLVIRDLANNPVLVINTVNKTITTLSGAKFVGDGSSLSGITGATGGVSNTASTNIVADSDANGSGDITFSIGSTEVIRIVNNGSGNAGVFIIKNQVNTLPTLSGNDIALINSNGKAAIKDSTATRSIAFLDMPDDTFLDTSWVIKKNGVRFIHNFNYGNNGTVTTAGLNTFVGKNTGNFTMGSTATQSYEASYNNGFGEGALEKIKTAWGTDAFGYTALNNLEIGYGTVAVGYYAGRFMSGNTPLTSAYYGTYIGAYTKPLANENTNEIVIGYNATGAGSNSVVLGNTAITKTILRGNVAFGVSDNNPTAKVDIQGSYGYNQLRLRTSYTPTSSADSNGNTGDISWDNDYIYVKTTVGWKRSALTTF